jgi:ribonuclease HI
VPWVTATLRGSKVYARAKDDGSLATEGGLVEIRYKRGDARAYKAAAANLTIPPSAERLDDSAFPDGAFSERTTDAAKGAKSVARSSKPSGRLTRADGAAPPVIDTKHAWIAYTDGACSGNPGPAGSGMVVIAPDGAQSEGFEYLGTSTNNVAELTAILRALEAVPPHAPVVVHTDSQYAIGVLTKGWKAKANQELIASIKAVLTGRKSTRFVYVAGHAGIELNERADVLARGAISARGSRPLPKPASP